MLLQRLRSRGPTIEHPALRTAAWLFGALLWPVGCAADSFSVREALDDTKLYFTAPLRWDSQDWLYREGTRGMLVKPTSALPSRPKRALSEEERSPVARPEVNECVAFQVGRKGRQGPAEDFPRNGSVVKELLLTVLSGSRIAGWAGCLEEEKTFNAPVEDHVNHAYQSKIAAAPIARPQATAETAEPA